MSSRGNHTARGGGHANKKQSKRPPQTREVTISKQLSYLLRHGAADEGIKLNEEGYADVADVLAWRRMSSLKVTLPELQNVVTSNDKQRYQMIPAPSASSQLHPTNPSIDKPHCLIRAVQGHSITTISASKLLTPISASDPTCPHLVVHGTSHNSWREIQKSGGLKPMNRNHIHFATKEPDRLPPLNDKNVEMQKKTDTGKEQVISGMRSSATVLIWVDVRRSLEGGVRWWRSENGVLLTEGMEKEVEGGKGKTERVLGFKWIRWVERRGNGDVLWKGEGVDVEREKLATRMGRASVGGDKSDGFDKES